MQGCKAFGGVGFKGTYHRNTIGFTGLSETTVIQWFAYFRDVCSWWLNNNPNQIGGPGLVVEIDESLISRLKNNVSRVPDERKWVFGAVCRDTRRGFLQIVDNDRSAARLLPLIQEHIAPCSIIHSDGWAAYNGIVNLPVQPPYQHLVVNHSENFVGPITDACTNLVENYWKNCKRRFKSVSGSNSVQLHHTWTRFFGGRYSFYTRKYISRGLTEHDGPHFTTVSSLVR